MRSIVTALAPATGGGASVATWAGAAAGVNAMTKAATAIARTWRVAVTAAPR